MAYDLKTLEKKSGTTREMSDLFHLVKETDLENAKANFVKNAGVAFAEVGLKIVDSLQKKLDELKAQKRKDEEARLDALQGRLDFDESLIKSGTDLTAEKKGEIWDDYVEVSNKMDAIHASRIADDKKEAKQAETARNVSYIVGGSIILGSIAYGLIQALIKKR